MGPRHSMRTITYYWVETNDGFKFNKQYLNAYSQIEGDERRLANVRSPSEGGHPIEAISMCAMGQRQTPNFRRACPDAIQNLTFASVSDCCYRLDLN
jgi:hypothetical protein